MNLSSIVKNDKKNRLNFIKKLSAQALYIIIIYINEPISVISCNLAVPKELISKTTVWRSTIDSQYIQNLNDINIGVNNWKGRVQIGQRIIF